MKVIQVLVLLCALSVTTASDAKVRRRGRESDEETSLLENVQERQSWVDSMRTLFDTSSREVKNTESPKEKSKGLSKKDDREGELTGSNRLIERLHFFLSNVRIQPDHTDLEKQSNRDLQEEKKKDKKKKSKKEKKKKKDKSRRTLGWLQSFIPTFLIPKTQVEEALIDSNTLQPLEISPAKFIDNDARVSTNALRMGLDHNVHKTILEYCNRAGITDRFHDLLVTGNELEPDSNSTETFDDFEWTVQRPQKDGLWNNNMHWVSPANDNAYQEYLKILGDAGFDKVLDKLGNHLGVEKLGIYQVSFHGVSKATNNGYYHVDFQDTNNKAWNVIIPLVLADETGPELGIVHDGKEKKRLGLYRYKTDEAILLGDDAEHVTAHCDYQGKDMRMVAIIYIADVDETNVDSVLSSYYGVNYPPQGDAETLQSFVHWGDGKALPTH